MPLYNPITEQQMPQPIARDQEYQAADQAHLAATDPHLQYPTQARADERYLRKIRNFDFTASGPFTHTTNQWNIVSPDFIFGELGIGSTWAINLYWQLDSSTFNNYCGAGILGCIYWQADLLANSGLLLPVEAHNEADFTCRIRIGRGNGLRKLELLPDRTINIASPGFFRASGVRLQ